LKFFACAAFAGTYQNALTTSTTWSSRRMQPEIQPRLPLACIQVSISGINNTMYAGFAEMIITPERSMSIENP
jgi:hypothetical protein